jgi:hypothetical protein
MEIQLHTFLILTLDGVLSFMTWLLHPREKASTTYLKGGCVGPRAGLHLLEKRELSFSCQESKNNSFLSTSAQSHYYTD